MLLGPGSGSANCCNDKDTKQNQYCAARDLLRIRRGAQSNDEGKEASMSGSCSSFFSKMNLKNFALFCD
ncbi:hypothetical protein G7K_1786-t1 [Saitoella complicata NRRL Y-17804]|uniref:Uncharacterized protein n=1 Tax=Saitoella complicata (strain BCRC 22490 / CBS 7301 / JCM 7358 / NBRC 10748 / NRRL Y-17804) TaxID=698492 RepID=A0A0E9NCL9_SAICN|nr:hypothetical protein G7K_1786-t1 [Saitoella complicata NRRL Y-17804]